MTRFGNNDRFPEIPDSEKKESTLYKYAHDYTHSDRTEQLITKSGMKMRYVSNATSYDEKTLFLN